MGIYDPGKQARLLFQGCANRGIIQTKPARPAGRWRGRIYGDDFEISPTPDLHQTVVSAHAGMRSTSRYFDTEQVSNPGYSLLEVGGTDDQVIENYGQN